MHKQVSVQLTWNSKFLSKFSRKPLSGMSDQKAPPPNEKLQIWDDQSLLWNTPLQNEKLQIWDDQSLLQNTPAPNEKLQIWDDQSLLSNTPLQNEKLQIWDDQSLLWNTPSNEKLQIWDDQSLLQNTPPPPVGLESGRSYVETNLYPPWIPLVVSCYDALGLLWGGNHTLHAVNFASWMRPMSMKGVFRGGSEAESLKESFNFNNDSYRNVKDKLCRIKLH